VLLESILASVVAVVDSLMDSVIVVDVVSDVVVDSVVLPSEVAVSVNEVVSGFVDVISVSSVC